MTATNRPTLRRQLRAAAVLLLIAGGVLGGAWGAYRLTVGRVQLDGERDYDFGSGLLVDGPVEFHHTFVLTNNGSSAVEVTNIRTSCGCTVAEPSTRTVEPGGTIEIAATMKLKSEGAKTSRIFLEYADGGVDVLHLAARARLKNRLTIVAGPARLVTGELLDRTVIYRDYDGNGEPPAPVLHAPAGVKATFAGWKQIARLRERAGMPARWSGRIHFEVDDAALESDAAVEVSVGPGESVLFPLPPAPGT